MERSKTGKIGEKAAARHLVEKGYKIVEKNCRLPFAEIDIVARHEKTLIFVEVKTINTKQPGRRNYWNPEDNVTSRKCLALKRAALYYANRVFERGGVVSDIRIDVIAIRLQGGGRATLRHYQNALSI